MGDTDKQSGDTRTDEEIIQDKLRQAQQEQQGGKQDQFGKDEAGEGKPGEEIQKPQG